MVTRSDACRKMKNGELRLLDVILKLNDQDVTDSLGKAFADNVREMTVLHMTVSRSLSIPFSPDLICEGKIDLKTEVMFSNFRIPNGLVLLISTSTPHTSPWPQKMGGGWHRCEPE